MPRKVLNAGLLLAFLVTLGLHWVLRTDPARTNVEYFPNMAHSARHAAFTPNPNFPDGKTLQAPVPGTIPRGFPPLDYQATLQDALRAGQELQNPFATNDAHATERGAAVFTNFCIECHGAGGVGNGPVAQRGFPAPASLVAPRAISMKDGQIFHILTYGQNNMPSYASQLSRSDRWRVILYVRSLQKQAQAATPAVPAADVGPGLAPASPPQEAAPGEPKPGATSAAGGNP